MEQSQAASILIVDDSHKKIAMIESILADLGQKLVTAGSGKEALRMLLDNDFAVILLDVKMPEMDGFETAELIRQRKKTEHTPIIFVTGMSPTEASAKRAYSLGAVDYIFTPVVPDVLRAKVKVFVDLFGLNRSISEQSGQLADANRTLVEQLDQIKVLNDALRASNRELESFSYSVSHDLQVPLRAIDGFSRILIENHAKKLDEEGKRLLNIVRDSTKRMAQLIDDLLAFSRLGRAEISKTQIDMPGLARLVYEETTAGILDRNIRFELKPLPPVIGDQSMLRQVLVNLIGNAVKFTRRTPEAAIEIGSTDNSKEVVYYIKDNGVGFDMQYKSKLFGIFQRLHRQNEFEGTGIGLSLVHRIIHRHGGRVWAEGKVNEGATFFFSLPKEARA